MAVKIRLARKGRKKKAYYHIVVADSRAPRDGRFIEKLGTYNPLTNPATIDIDFDGALNWLMKGAQPTDTCRAILSYKGIMLKKHLIEGVKKGAFGEEEAEKRFQTWMNEKADKIEKKVAGLEKSQEDQKTQRLEAEKKINETRAAEIAKKRSDLAAEAAAASKPAEEVVEESDEVVAEEANAEAAPVEESVKEEVVVETAPEEVVDATTEETAPVEEPVVEASTEEVVSEEPTKDEPAPEAKAEESKGKE
jgi:small subunit ribosomal protein S16